jgi:multimeric flavodoxin WrbA
VARLLIVHHTPSPATHTLLGAVREGATNSAINGVEVVVRPALTAGALDVLEADGYLLGTPANLGYMAGALKHFFDQIYYPCLDATAQRPFGVWLHGNSDVTGARRGIETITTGLQWRLAQEAVEVIGEPGREDVDRCWELGAALAATLMD